MIRIAIFASGSGSNAENAVTTFRNSPTLEVGLVATNRAEAGVVERMKRLGLPVKVIANNVWEEDPQSILALLEENRIDMIVLAGFLRRIHPSIVDRYERRIINIHPSLLPAFGGKGMWGMNVHRAVSEAGVAETGATVHYVSNVIDGGEIIDRETVAITPGEDPESIAAKVHEAEMILYPRAIAAVASAIAKDSLT